MTLSFLYAKIVSNATVASATNLKGRIKMATLMRRINVISRCAITYKSERLSGELSGCHHPFVFCITRNPGMFQDAISRQLFLNKSTVARTLSYLEEHGYVRREADASDKRVLHVYPTDKMLEALPRVREISKEWNSLIAEGISEQEFELFSSVLEKIEARARAALGGGKT